MSRHWRRHIALPLRRGREALLPLARDLGVIEADVYGVGLSFAAKGAYAGFDVQSLLTRAVGKPQLLKGMLHTLSRPILHVGDGMTDAVTRDVVDAFAAYTGFVRRESVVGRADFSVDSFAALQVLVFG
jgi:phosphoserine phosphatase